MFNEEKIARNFIELANLRGFKTEESISDENYAAFFILASSATLMQKSRGCISRDGINFKAIKRGASSGERVAIALAQNLYNGGVAVQMDELCNYLDADTFAICMNAVHIRKFGPKKMEANRDDIK